MKVLLIFGPFKSKEIYGDLSNSAPVLAPLELAYLASYLTSAGHKVLLVDAHASELSLKDIEFIVKREEPDLVGTATDSPIFSFIYSLYSRSLELARLVKKVNPSLKIFLIGYHPTILTQEVLNQDCVDYAVVGEPEFTVNELCAALEKKTDLKEIAGLGFKRDREVIINSPRHYIENLDILPPPAYHLLPLHRYRFASDTPVPVKGMSLRATRGCAFGCYFCSAPGFWKRKVSTHSVEYIISTMNYLHERHKFTRFQFHDDNFGINRAWILQFCQQLLRNKYRYIWECYSRFDLLDADLLSVMKKAGCRLISLGVESGSDEILEKVKGLTKHKIEHGMRLLKEAGIKSRLFFMIGPPAKTKHDIRNTVEYAIKLDPDIFIATISIPFPGSKFYEDMKEENSIPDFETGLIPLYRASHDFACFSKEYLNMMIKQAYRRFYVRPKFIFRQIKYIRPGNINFYFRGLLGLLR